MGNIHLAVIDQQPDGSLFNLAYIETDFTNTPRYLRRAAGDLTQPIWAWPIAPYGETPAWQGWARFVLTRILTAGKFAYASSARNTR
ncbi:hypothetical protein [Methylomonas sp. UP202]|uniref:hypothetical protein n=1 Tax=Methylomonas sp. UP202 TaxID=3040943 RepID=UPI00247ACFA0|nr:hypothetical protein [Methylomonas sp. UP202]WGS87489.1 hypothetical protein QC632_06960 [Methylomonas sp. UP202]